LLLPNLEVEEAFDERKVKYKLETSMSAVLQMNLFVV